MTAVRASEKPNHYLLFLSPKFQFRAFRHDFQSPSNLTLSIFVCNFLSAFITKSKSQVSFGNSKQTFTSFRYL